jgi:probable HAF family extracellular repeat protein
VTFNFTILSPVGIHQSADFRISETERDAVGNWITLQDNASKIVSLQYQHWSGLLTYCGIGLWQGRRTDQYVSEWLAAAAGSATFHEVIEIIREQGSRWIAEINAATGRSWGHSFVLAGFVEGVTRYAIISNYQGLSGDFNFMAGALQVDAGSTDGVHVIVTGIRAAVSHEGVRLLKHLAETERNFAVIRHYLAEANARAAGAGAAKNGISMACLTASCDPTGAQWSQLYGEPPGPLVPTSIIGGTAMHRLMEQFMKAYPNAKMLQAASVSSASHAATVAERIECNLRDRSGFDEAQRESIASVEDVGAINEYCLNMRAINEGGCIVGSVRILPDSLPHALFWHRPEAIQDLGTLGGPQGFAHDINECNEVVGGAFATATDMHAFVWTRDGGFRDLGTLGGQNSSALAINDLSQIVGQSQYQGGGEHACIWTAQSGLRDLFPGRYGFSRAIGITNAGIIVGWAGRGVMAEYGFVLYPGGTAPLEIVAPSGRPFFISAVNDAGLVIGEGDDALGRRRPFTWTREGGLTQLVTEEPFHPVDVDRHGNIVGHVQGGRHPLTRPFIYTAAGELLPLPFPEEHSTDVVAINGHGCILGAAHGPTWKHVHPLIWRLK